MVAYRPHRGGLYEAMLEAKEFEDIDKMLEYVVERHNNLCGELFHISKNDLVTIEYCDGDWRVGWNNGYIICYKAYKDIEDKEGYIKYFGITGDVTEEIGYDEPIGTLGTYSTSYSIKPEEWVKEHTNN